MFRDNSLLVSTTSSVMIGANDSEDIYQGAGGASAFVVADGNVGDDTFLDFGSDDSFIIRRQIFDENNDGFIDLGMNGVFDVDRFGPGPEQAGADQFQIIGENGVDVTEIRYLGSKGGQFAYADGATLRNLFDAFGQDNVVEGTIGNDTDIDLSGGARVLLQDNGLGLNMGSDTVNGFGDDDLFVTTRQLFDSDVDQVVGFGRNGVLDVSGSTGPRSDDPSRGPGGQVDFVGVDGLAYLGTNTIDGVTYYYYGTADTTVNPFAL